MQKNTSIFEHFRVHCLKPIIHIVQARKSRGRRQANDWQAVTPGCQRYQPLIVHHVSSSLNNVVHHWFNTKKLVKNNVLKMFS